MIVGPSKLKLCLSDDILSILFKSGISLSGFHIWGGWDLLPSNRTFILQLYGPHALVL